MLEGKDGPSHLKAFVDPGTPVPEEEFTGFVVRKSPDSRPRPGRAPQSQTYHVRKKLVVGDEPALQMIGYRTLEPFVREKVETAETGTTADGAFRGSIQGDNILMVRKLQE
jgi:hypothetical protein